MVYLSLERKLAKRALDAIRCNVWREWTPADADWKKTIPEDRM